MLWFPGSHSREKRSSLDVPNDTDDVLKLSAGDSMYNDELRKLNFYLHMLDVNDSDDRMLNDDLPIIIHVVPM